MKTKNNMTSAEALSRLQNLCSAQEKCTGDIIEKLRKWNICNEEGKIILEKLIRDRFVDDQRFAGFFVKDKQNINKWGKEKIRYALMRKNLSREVIDDALSSLPKENFEESLKELLSRKSRELGKYESYEKRNRLIRFAIQRGFDYDLIFRLVDQYVND